MLDEKYLINKNTILKESYFKRNEMKKQKKEITNISKEYLTKIFLTYSFFILFFTILSQLKLWTLLPVVDNSILFQYTIHCLVSSTPIMILFFLSDIKSISYVKKMFLKNNIFNIITDFLAFLFVFFVFYFLFFGFFNVMYSILLQMPKSIEFLEISTDHHLYLTIVGAFFFLVDFFLLYRKTHNKDELINKKENINKKEKENDLLIKNTRKDLLFYLKNNIKNTKNIEYLFLIKEEYNLLHLNDDIIKTIDFYAKKEGFEDYKTLRKNELIQQQEMIYND